MSICFDHVMLVIMTPRGRKGSTRVQSWTTVPVFLKILEPWNLGTPYSRVNADVPLLPRKTSFSSIRLTLDSRIGPRGGKRSRVIKRGV